MDIKIIKIKNRTILPNTIFLIHLSSEELRLLFDRKSKGKVNKIKKKK